MSLCSLVVRRARGPAVGNVLHPGASVHLPVAGSTQEDVALFAEADAIIQQQQAEIGMMAPLANTQYQGTLPTAIDPTGSFRKTPYGSSASAADVATIFLDTVQVFPMDADDGVPATHVNTTQEDYFPLDQEAYLPTTHVDSLFTPTQVQVTPPRQARRNAAPKEVGRGRNRRARRKGPLRPRPRRPVRRRGTAPCLSGNRPGPAPRSVRCPPGCRPANWEPDLTTTETNLSLTTTETIPSGGRPSQSADLHSSNSSFFLIRQAGLPKPLILIRHHRSRSKTFFHRNRVPFQLLIIRIPFVLL